MHSWFEDYIISFVGKKRLSKKEVASVCFESIQQFLASKKDTLNLREVYLVHHEEEYVKRFNDHFADLFNYEYFGPSV